MKRPASLKGFTLIELLIVIVIIGILSAGAFALFTGSQAKARDAIRKNDVSAAQTAIQLFMNENADVTPSIFELTSPAGGAVACTAQNTACLTGMVGKYLQKAIAAPKTGEKYAYCTDGTKFVIAALLEDGRPATPTAANIFSVGSGTITDIGTAATSFLSTVPTSDAGTCVLFPA